MARHYHGSAITKYGNYFAIGAGYQGNPIAKYGKRSAGSAG